MNWQGVPISELSDDDLYFALISMGEMDNFRVTKLQKPLKRHKKIFDKHPPIENAAFTDLIKELNQEFKSRKLKGLSNV